MASNWSTGTVGSGTLSRGFSAGVTNGGDAFTNTAVAPNTGIGYEYNTNANSVGTSPVNHILKRTHSLSNGQIIWDLAGNAWEWNDYICTQGSGADKWYNSGAWIEWTETNLSDYEKGAAGPAGNYTSANAIGRYYGCISPGRGMLRGGNWNAGLFGGVFATILTDGPTEAAAHVGFRCTR